MAAKDVKFGRDAREGILKGVNDYAGKNFDGSDVRDGLFGAVAVKIKEPIFESQTKNKFIFSTLK